MRRRYLKSSQINSISPNNPSLSQAKDQAQAVGAVPAAATGGIISTLSEIGAALIKYPVIMYVGPDPAYNPKPIQL